KLAEFLSSAAACADCSLTACADLRLRILTIGAVDASLEFEFTQARFGGEMKRVLRNKVVIAAGVAIVVVAAFLLLGGSKAKTTTAPPSAPLEVEVAQVEQKDVPIYTEWIGSLDGMVNAEIKSQVTGYLLTKNYTEGSFVKKGQLLFEIDPRPFQAV